MSHETDNTVSPPDAAVVGNAAAPAAQADTYRLEPLDISPEEWDSRIQAYPTTLVYHESAWLDYLEKSHHGRRVLLACKNGQETVGYFCGMTVRKGPFRILGAPFRGWWTANMGPIAHPGHFDAAAFLRALDRYCRATKVHFLELCCDWLDRDALEGAGFTAIADVTHSMPVGTAEQMWSGMYKTTRNYVRRAEKSGVRIEEAHDESVVLEFYEQLKAVFAKQHLAPSHPVEWLLNMWSCVQPKGGLIGLRALHGERCIATYLLACDERVMWGLATASWPDALDLRPNELIHWRAIEMAVQRGLKRYDFCGGGSYKKKYGAQEIPRVRWQKAYSPVAKLGYRVYAASWSAMRKTMQRLRSWRRRGHDAGPPEDRP